MAHVLTSLYADPFVVKNHGRAAGIIHHPKRGWSAYTTTDHEEVTVHLNPVPWVTAITAYAFDTTTGGGGGYTAHYQYSTDGGTTWSGEAAIANITSHTFTAKRLSLRLIFKRTGPPSGTFILSGFHLSANFNALATEPSPPLWPFEQADTPSAGTGLRSWTTAVNLNARIVEVVRQMAADLPATFGRNAVRYQFHNGHPDTCRADYTRPFIFIYDIRTLSGTSNLKQTTQVQFRMGVKRTKMSVKHETEANVFGLFQNQVQQMFGEMWNLHFWTILTVGGVTYHDVSLASLGVKDCRTFGSAFRHDGGEGQGDDCGVPESWETVVEFTLRPAQHYFNYLNL